MAEIGRLQSFINIASAPGVGEKDAIKLRGDGDLKLTGRAGTFFTFASTHRDTMKAFIAAVREQYGDHIADLTSNRLANELAASKPLKAYRVRDLLNMAEKYKTNIDRVNRQAVEVLLKSDGANRRPIDDAIDSLCAKHEIPPGEGRSLLLCRVGEHLRSLAEKGGIGSEIISMNRLTESIANADPAFVGKGFKTMIGILEKDGDRLPGEITDKMRLIELGIGRESGQALCQAVFKLTSMRSSDNQPTGDLTRETIWRSLFGESLPDEAAGDRFGAAVDKKIADMVSNLAQRTDKPADAIGNSLYYMTLEDVEKLAASPDSFSLSNVPGIANWMARQGDAEAAEGSLATDLRQRGSVVSSRLMGGATVPPPDITFNTVVGAQPTRITIGPYTDFEFNNDEDADRYFHGDDNSLSDRLREQSRDICGGSMATRAQVDGVMFCLGAQALTPLKELAPLAGADFNEFSNVSVTLTRQYDGSVRARFSTPEALRERVGDFSMEIEVGVNGEMVVDSFMIIPPVSVMRQRQRTV